MKTLTPQQMDAAHGVPPVAVKRQETPSGPVVFSVTITEEGFAVASSPFEVIGAPELHPGMSEAISRMLTCARAVANDEFPPAPGAPLSIAEMDALTPGDVVEDRHGDRAVRTEKGLWAFPETALLPTTYVHKHYSPIVLISEKEGSR